jgi:hypothetical protein
VVRAERAESVKAAGHRKGLAVVSKLCNNSWYYMCTLDGCLGKLGEFVTREHVRHNTGVEPG